MISVEVADRAWRRAAPAVVSLTRQAADIAAQGRGDIAILLTDDDALRALNARFLGKDRPTNVLAFPSAEPGRLGDVALAIGVCRREAAQQGKALADHLRHLVVHGVLHLLGYDHASDEEASRMEGLERQLLARMNIADPYRDGPGK